MLTIPNKAVFSVAEVAELLGVSRDVIYRAITKREIYAKKIGARLVVPRGRLAALLGEEE